jgi:hypothetical protein
MNIEMRRVRVETQTHSALYTQQGEERAVVRPGITLRDCRLAVLVENMFNEKYLQDGRGVAARGNKPDIGQPSTVEAICTPELKDHHLQKGSS